MSRRVFVAVFDREEDLLGAVKAARAEGLLLHDVFTPYPVHGLDEAMGLRRSRLPWACLVFGLLGGLGGLWLEWWTSAVDWPLNVGGKPLNSMPAFVPVIFELTVLLAGVGTFLVFLAAARLRPRKAVRLPAARLSDDRFALVLGESGADFDPAALETEFRERHGAVATHLRLEGEAA